MPVDQHWIHLSYRHLLTRRTVPFSGTHLGGRDDSVTHSPPVCITSSGAPMHYAIPNSPSGTPGVVICPPGPNVTHTISCLLIPFLSVFTLSRLAVPSSLARRSKSDLDGLFEIFIQGDPQLTRASHAAWVGPPAIEKAQRPAADVVEDERLPRRRRDIEMSERCAGLGEGDERVHIFLR